MAPQSSTRNITEMMRAVSVKSIDIEKESPQDLQKPRTGLDYEEWSMHFPSFVSLEEANSVASPEEMQKTMPNTYTNPRGDEFFVRGPGYLDGKKKSKGGEKVRSEDPVYSVAGVQVFRSKKSLEHIASKVESLKEYIAKHTPKNNASKVPEFLVVTWMFKSTWAREYTSVVHLFRRKAQVNIESPTTGFERAFKNFLEGDEKVKRNKFKFCFQIMDAPSALRKAVKLVGGERPVLIGKALTTKFFQTDSYLEIDQDVGSSLIASSLNSTILKAAATICVSTSWIIEAQEEAELPEQLLGSVRWHYVDPKAAYIELDDEYHIKAPQ